MNVSHLVRSARVVVMIFFGLNLPAYAQESKADNTAGAVIPEDLMTVAEASDYTATSTSAEVSRFLATCDSRAEHVTQFEFGRTSLDQPMMAAVFASSAVTGPPKDERLVVLLLGNIHSGECDGKEALLMLARELTLDAHHPLLQKLVIIIAPNYNADGNDNMSPDNRPGQIGPIQGMGKRETAQGFDLNRDFMKLETPEGRALVRLINQWNPHVFIDCHTTNGSIHRYPLTYDIPHGPAVSASLRSYLREKMMPEVTGTMKAAGYDTFYYGNFNEDYSRWESFGFEPRYSTEYLGLRGRIGILSESYSYTDYKTRIVVTREFVLRCLNYVVDHSGEISPLLKSVESEMASQAASKDSELPLNATLAPFEGKRTVLGRLPNSDEPKDYDVEFWGNYLPANKTAIPNAYVIPASETTVVDNLRAHGIRLEQLAKTVRANATVRTVRSIQKSVRSFQKHNMVTVTTDHREEMRELAEGSYVVSTAQPLGRLAIWLLEPESVDGLVTWNFFDASLKEGTDFPIVSLKDVSALSLSAVEAKGQ
ncbi:MAG: M14 family metallopeptidase [Planctomycetaceae bacterium]